MIIPRPRKRRLSRVFMALVLSFGLSAAAGAAELSHARRMMAATANPMATEAALAVMREGGSAVDAAVAAQMVLGVVEPQASGIGGGALMLVWDQKARRLRYYEGLSSSPTDIEGSLADEDLGPASAVRSGRAVAVPGAVKLLALAYAHHGRLPWKRLFQPAITLADGGFSMPPYLHQTLRARAEALRQIPAFAALYFGADGRPRPIGSVVVNRELAASMRLLADKGADTLYGGVLGALVTSTLRQLPVPGWLDLSDLISYQAEERPPVCAEVLARRICSAAPPSSGGVAVLQTLLIAEAAGITKLPAGSAEEAHVFLEASRLATADRRRWIGDPDSVDVPLTGLLERDYIAGRAGLITAGGTIGRVPPGRPGQRQGALPPEAVPRAEPTTTHLSIVDAEGNAVAFTTTNNLNFGAEAMAGGFVLNNAMTNFSTAATLDGVPPLNRLEPDKRPATTMAPTIVFTAKGEPEIVIGAGGGAWIPDAVARALLEMLGRGVDPAVATSNPRLGGESGGAVVERGTAAEALVPALQALGQVVKVESVSTGLQIIRRLPDGRLEGAADPRRDGVARGE